MSVENGYGSRKNEKVSDPFGIKGKWTVIAPGGFVEHVEVDSVEDLIKHRMIKSPPSVIATFGEADGQKYLNWLNGHQPKNGK